LHYRIFGEGKKTILAFHGYGQEGYSLKVLADAMPEYRFYAFDLFFHGNSRLRGKSRDRLVTVEKWNRIVQILLKEEAIGNFELLGFSMGGKFVFATLSAFPDRIEKIMLIAPDGVKNMRWYSFATGSSVMRAVFKRVVVEPKLFFSVLRISRTLGLAHPGMIKFAEREMQALSKRKRVYNSWAYFRNLKVDLPKIIRLINTHAIPAHFYFGKYDKVINVQHLSSLLNALNEKEVHILNSGHSNLIQAVAAFIKEKGTG
jgi:pimeloyl-ACP methyl ester carboxylesterase